MDRHDATLPHHLIGLEPETLPELTSPELEAQPHWSRKWLLRLGLFVGWISAFYLVAWLKIVVPAVVDRVWR